MPAIYEMQARAIFEAAAEVRDKVLGTGAGGVDAAERIKAQADTTMERLRQERIIRWESFETRAEAIEAAG